jgi:hypothetical protein
MEISDETPYAVNTADHFYQVFFGSTEAKEYGIDGKQMGVWVYTIDDCMEMFDEALKSYVQFPNRSVGVYRLNHPDPARATALLSVTHYVNDSILDPHVQRADLRTIEDHWEVSVHPHNYGPLDVASYEDLQDYFYLLLSMNLQFQIYSIQLTGTHPIEHEWTVMVGEKEERKKD